MSKLFLYSCWDPLHHFGTLPLLLVISEITRTSYSAIIGLKGTPLVLSVIAKGVKTTSLLTKNVLSVHALPISASDRERRLIHADHDD